MMNKYPKWLTTTVIKERQGEGYDRKYCDSGTDRSILYLSDLQRL